MPPGRLQAGPENSTVLQANPPRLGDSRGGGFAASCVTAMRQSGSFDRSASTWKYRREFECDANQSAQ